ncbi:hypothetical protein M948_19205 [Virgibacillus sp. CM-4]|nr:hypothetical protein M948_19205 [Virgibacillus sp. CM-4]
MMINIKEKNDWLMLTNEKMLIINEMINVLSLKIEES